MVVGDLVRIRPGERLPVDGEVVGGHSAVDQSFVAGEPIPIEKRQGDTVIGGSINGTGTLLVKVTAVGEGSFLHKVIREVEDARALKPGILHLVDRVLRVFTPTVLIVSALAFLGWFFGSWLVAGEPNVERAVFAGLSVLVMGYPCAVGISAPLSIVRGAGEAAERGILMRTGEAFQGFRLVGTIILDKTGTLTEGRPILQEIEALGGAGEELLGIAAAAEASSEHPLAQAVVKTAFAMGGGTDIAIDSADIIILSNRLDAVPIAYETSRRGYRKMVQNVALAFMFNGIGIPIAATGLLYPVWAMVVMAVSVTTIFFNSLWGRPRLFFDAILSVGRPLPRSTPQAA